MYDICLISESMHNCQYGQNTRLCLFDITITLAFHAFYTCTHFRMPQPQPIRWTQARGAVHDGP